MGLLGQLGWTLRLDNKKLKTDAKKSESIVGGMSKKFSSFLSPQALGVAGVVAVGVAFKKIISTNAKFEKSLSSLQSILGVSNKELKFFKDESIRMGSATTQTASQVAAAFKLIGSQKPELLKDRDALAKVTEQAIVLAEAAEVDVPVAAKALTGALNQMGKSAKDSGKFINILAAGSKEGAADIPYLNTAIEKSGAVARDANLSFAQLVAGIETIAPSITEPSTAGLQFKNVLLELQKASYGYASGQFNLTDALNEVNKELSEIEDPAKRASREMDIFGKISLVAGKAMINNVDAYENFTEKVSGTNTAYEQQKTNTDNLMGSIEKFKSALEGLILGLNSEGGLTGAFKGIVDVATFVIDNFDKIIDLLKIVAPAYIAYVVAVKGATLANKLFGSSLKATPIGLLLAGVTAVIAAYQLFKKELSGSQKAINEFNSELIKEKVELNNVFSALKSTAKGTEERKDLINQINDKYGKYLDNLLTEKSSLKEIENAQKLANKAIEQNLALKFKQQATESAYNDAINIRIKATKTAVDVATKTNKYLAGQATADINTIIDKAVKNGKIAVKDFDSYIKKYKVSGIDLINLSHSLQAVVDAEKNKNSELENIKNAFSAYDIDLTKKTEKEKAKAVKGETTKVEATEKPKASSAGPSFDIEKMKIDAMKDGIAKRLALIDYETKERIKQYKQAGIYTAEIASQIEIDKQNAITKAQKDVAQKEYEKQKAINDLDLSLMQEGQSKEIAIINNSYKEKLKNLDNYNLSKQQRHDFELQLEVNKNAEIDKVKDNYEAQRLAKIVEIENLKNSFIADNLTKQLAQIDLEYQDKLNKLDNYNLSIQEKTDLQNQIMQEKEIAKDEIQKQYDLTKLEQEQELKLTELELLDASENEKAVIEAQYQLDRLEKQKEFSANMTDVQKQALDNQIKLQRKAVNDLKLQKKETEAMLKGMGDAFSNLGNQIIDINKDTEKSEYEKAQATKTAIADSLQAVIIDAIVKFVASALGKTGYPAGLILAPLAGVAAAGIFSGIRSQLGFEEGGIVPGNSYSGDRIQANVNSGEMILNARQQAKLLWQIANGGGLGGTKDVQITNQLLKEQNQLLKNNYKLLVNNGVAYQTRNGQLTGTKIYLDA